MPRVVSRIAAALAGFFLVACASGGGGDGPFDVYHVQHTVLASLAAPEPPVYNAIFTPSKSGTPLRLSSGQPTQVRFFIAPPDVQNAIPVEKWTVDKEILTSPNPHLTITLICLVCAGDELQKKPITYFRQHGYSSEAVFSFTPLRDRTATGKGQIVFSIEHDGIERNHIVLDVVVDSPSSKAEAAATTVVLPLDQARAITTHTQDVTIDISRSATGYVEVTLTPSPTSRIYDDLAPLAFANGDPKTFTTTLSVNDLEKWTRHTYLDLWDLVQLQQSALKSIYQGRPDGDLRLPPSAPLRMTDADRDLALQKLRQLGKYLYARLFRDGDLALQQLMASMESAGSRGAPLRVVINTTGIYAPWQLLHPLAGVDRFWGLTCELSVRPTAVRRGPADLAPEARMTSAIFGQYSDPADADGIAGLAAAEAQWLGARLPENSLHIVPDRDGFISALAQHRADVLLIMTLGHAAAGTIIRDGTPLPDAVGQRLLFAPNKYVTPESIYKLTLSGSSPTPFFGRGAIVFLNGCETGTAGVTPTTDDSFPGTFMRLGARGVIVTEAPVWAYFAANFGEHVVQAILQGAPAAQALRETRLRFMQANNPLGLLYSYYGSIAPVLIPAVPKAPVAPASNSK